MNAVRAALPLLGAGLLLNLPGLARVGAQWSDLLALHGEWFTAAAVVGWLSHKRPLPGLLAAVWVGLLLLELVRLAGQLLTSADPQLYDVLFLFHHLVILALDLYGPASLLAPLGLVVAVPLVVVAVRALLRPALARPQNIRLSAILAGAAGVAALLPGGLGARWVTPAWGRNVADSLHTWRLTQRSIHADPYQALRATPPADRPDLSLYVVESYGRVHATSAQLEPDWSALLDELGPLVDQAGFHVVSGWATAPVSGGRSWISDASTLLGMELQYESVWSHVQPHTPRLTHLPGWLAHHGYQTVVCRPKDRARAGLPLRNDFGWQHTVFAADLDYAGAKVGWGEVPDQYTLGFLHERALPDIPTPRFLFFHGVSSHGPWSPPPPVEQHWQDVGHANVPTTEAAAPDQPDVPGDILRVQARRYGKKSTDIRRARARRIGDFSQAYGTAIAYTLRSIALALPGYPRPPAGHLVVIYGDHQPALLTPEGEFDVPVHILATDPSWLAPFEAHGFTAGLRPDDHAAPVSLHALYPLLAQALVGQDLPDVPLGVRLEDAL